MTVNRTVIMIALAFTLGGCANSAPVPMGKDTYMVANTGAWSWSSGAVLAADLYREADSFCRGQGRHLMPVNTSSNHGSFTEFAHASLQFRCLEDVDPELARPTLEPVPNVRIDVRSR